MRWKKTRSINARIAERTLWSKRTRKKEKRTFRLIRNRKLAFLSCNPRNVFRMRMKMNTAETDIITNKWRKFNFTLSLARFHSDVWANELNVIEFFFWMSLWFFFIFFFAKKRKIRWLRLQLCSWDMWLTSLAASSDVHYFGCLNCWLYALCFLIFAFNFFVVTCFTFSLQKNPQKNDTHTFARSLAQLVGWSGALSWNSHWQRSAGNSLALTQLQPRFFWISFLVEIANGWWS